jgi:hypothetical protein
MTDIPYENGTISSIYSEHSLEHLSFENCKKALQEWFRVLKNGGELLLLIPDLELCCKNYLNSNGQNTVNYIKDNDWYRATIFGYQKDANGSKSEFQFHLSGYNKNEIKQLLQDIGFVIEYCKNYNGYGTPSIEIKAIKSKNDKKIAWLTVNNDFFGPIRLRMINVSNELKKHGYFSEIVDNYMDIINYDIIIIRNFSENDYNNIKYLKSLGKKIFFDCCESLFEFDYFKECLEICDKVICCSTKLAEKVYKINNNVIVIEDAFEI